MPGRGSMAAFMDGVEAVYVGRGYPRGRAMPDFGGQLTQW
jgi:hypothetical protein